MNNALCILFSHCGRPLMQPFGRNAFNHPIVITCFIWAVIILILGLFIAWLAYSYLKSKDNFKKAMTEATLKHEIVMKEMFFEQEKYWFFQKELKKDYQKELNDRIKELENEKKKLEEDLDKEKKDRSEALEKKRLQSEHEFYEKILKTFYSTDKPQQTNK